MSSNELIKINEEIDQQHQLMLSNVINNLPQVNALSMNFGKTQSQFMDNMLTTSHPTPIRNIRQTLAEINRSIEALQEAYFKQKKEEIEIKKLERKLLTETDELEIELIRVEIAEKQTWMETRKKYISGAVRSVYNYQLQYRTILEKLGKESFDEIDFEKEEEEYHIKKAFEQGLNAARSNGGRIDEGNQIYLTQLGINGTVAMLEVIKYLEEEERSISNGIEINAQHQWDFLENMYQKFKGSAIKYAEKKGLKLENSISMIGCNYDANNF